MSNFLPGNGSPSLSGGLRVKVFLDFWNFTLSMKSVDRGFETDYRQLGAVLAQAALATVHAGARLDYEGMTVYGSYQDGEKDAPLRRWFETISGFPGVSVRTLPRRAGLVNFTCSRCRRRVEACPHCGHRLAGFKEKGVDVRIATDLIGLAWSGQYDIAVLVSSDGDFVPMAEALNAQSRKIVHAAFPPKAQHLSRSCWASFSVPGLREKFRLTAEAEEHRG